MMQSGTIKQVPQDILVEILLRLPVKSLCRFKCVSNVWHNIMIDSQFVKLQLNKSIESNRLTYVAYYSSDFPHRFELDYESLLRGDAAKQTVDDSLFVPETRGRDENKQNMKLTRKMEVWDSCDGLLCVFSAPETLVLVNPSTRESKTILDNYDPSDSRSLIGGFGYDELHDDYKVVKINHRHRIPTVEVYSLNNCSWSYNRDLPDSFGRTYIEDCKGVRLNGAIHWITCHAHHVDYITAFDLTKEEFFNIPMPDSSSVHAVLIELYTMAGCLCIIPTHPCQPLSEFWIWVMEIYGVKESWKRISLTFSFRNYSYRNLAPVSFPKSNEALFLLQGRLFLYNQENGNQKEINIGPIPTYNPRFFMLDTVFSYVESLVSLGYATQIS